MTQKIVESVNAKIDEFPDKPDDANKSHLANDEQKLMFIELDVQKDVEQNSAVEESQLVEDEEDEEHEEVIAPEQVIPRYVRLNHPENQIIGDKNIGVQTRRKIRDRSCLISIVEPKTVREALKDDDWLKIMNEELDQTEKNNTWSLVPRVDDKNVIGTNWVFRNKLNEEGEVIRNKEILVCKGYAEEEGEIMERPLHQLLGLKVLEFYLHLQLLNISKFIKWMLSQHF